MPERRRARHGEAQGWVKAVASGETDECQFWPFLSQTGETKRPVIWSNAEGRERPVAQVVLEMVGRTLGEGEQANHTCDEPFCCNPRHLYAGTQHDNIRDAIRRGRMRGLSDEVVAEVHRLSAVMGYKRIAKTLDVTFDAARYHARRARREMI